MKVLKEYGMEVDEKMMKNSRIRSINPQTYKMLLAYSDDYKTLDEYSIQSLKSYALEVKKDDEIFEDYNPDIIYINLYKWEDEYKNLEEKDFKFDKMKIDKTLLMTDLKKLIYNQYSIPETDKIILFKKTEYGLNNYQITELFTNDEEMGNQINCILSDNSKLFLEIILDSNLNFKENSNFIQHFDENSANVIINFNFPIKNENNLLKKPTKIRVGTYKFDNSIEIKKNKNLSELKKRISEVLNISKDQFIMKKNSHNGVELKNLNELIDKHTTSNMNIYIEYGIPQKDTELKINVYRTQYDFTFFLVFPYKTIDEGILKVDLNWTIKELKLFIIAELERKSIQMNHTDIENIYIREYKNDRPTRFYKDESTLSDLQFTENKKIIIQNYNLTKIIYKSQNDLQLSVRMWDPSQWKISAPYEIVFYKGMTFLDLSQILIQLFPGVEAQNLSAYKIINEMNAYMDDFKKYKVSIF
jgi:hypothetical protein